ncbi:MAG: response regulator [Opitutaceae bacterium]|nr:response regulator [Cephaloticoccus sp.]MCP5530301.1 response regulator [Opitutaceae bacterium]
MSKPSILVVDDEQDICGIAQLLLENAGCDVVCTTNAARALAAVEQRDFDLLITDMLMPEMDGVELINSVRRTKPDQRIMAISGGGMAPRESYLQIASMYGVNGVLAKPFSRDQLLKAVLACGIELPEAN